MSTIPDTTQSMSPDRTTARILFDLTTSAIWWGPSVGIVRVESRLGRWGLYHLDNLVPVFFDPLTRTFRRLGRPMAGDLLSQRTAIDRGTFGSPARRGRRKTDRIPVSLQPLAMWLLQTRRMSLHALERIRLERPDSRTAWFADRLQRAIMTEKYRAVMVNTDGSRRRCVPIDAVFEAPIGLGSSDTLVCTGAGWNHSDIRAIAQQKWEVGFRFVLLCFDLIPLMFPQFYKPADVEIFREYYHIAFPIADLVVFSSRTIEADARAYCSKHGLALRDTAVCALGADIHGAPGRVPLPAGLERNRYALLVSTIEPRKGHRMIYEVWLRLLETGVPQRARFKLVFAGRVGWLVENLMRDLCTDSRLAGTLEILTDADDAEISVLYQNAAFCLYPSRYEGYGLPVVESFFYGKAILASNGGAVPEVVGDLSPCLDPDDPREWQRMLGTWIEEPAARAAYVERIQTSFHPLTWDESAQAFFALVSRVCDRPDAPTAD
jgi:glycosyltransferase involved in cell wall biosynthesis